MNERDDIVVLNTPDGEEIEFENIAGIALDGKYYVILQPVELVEGMEEDEALVFEVTIGEDETESFSIVLDDEVLEAVFDEYYRLCEEEEGQN